MFSLYIYIAFQANVSETLNQFYLNDFALNILDYQSQKLHIRRNAFDLNLAVARIPAANLY